MKRLKHWLASNEIIRFYRHVCWFCKISLQKHCLRENTCIHLALTTYIYIYTYMYTRRVKREAAANCRLLDSWSVRWAKAVIAWGSTSEEILQKRVGLMHWLAILPCRSWAIGELYNMAALLPGRRQGLFVGGGLKAFVKPVVFWTISPLVFNLFLTGLCLKKGVRETWSLC